jgi:hypothetical protein
MFDINRQHVLHHHKSDLFFTAGAFSAWIAHAEESSREKLGAHFPDT